MLFDVCSRMAYEIWSTMECRATNDHAVQSIDDDLKRTMVLRSER